MSHQNHERSRGNGLGALPPNHMPGYSQLPLTGIANATHLVALESYPLFSFKGDATSIVVCMTFSRSSLTLCRSARMLSTVCGIFRRCSSKASFSIRNKLVLTLKPTMSGVRSNGWGKMPADVICSSSTSLGNLKAWMLDVVSMGWEVLTAASSRRRLMVLARYPVSFVGGE